MTRALAFLTILPSRTFEPAINPIFGILNASCTIALPKFSSTFSGSKRPSKARVTS